MRRRPRGGDCARAAITNGTPDGNNHPSVGVILATDFADDNCAAAHQLVSDCSGVLVAPDVFLTTRGCAAAFQAALEGEAADEVWVILAENPFDAASSAFDCTRFLDVDENGIHFDPNGIPSLGLMELASPVLDIAPAALPVQDRLQTVPRGQDFLTFASMSTVPGMTIFSLRRRAATGRTVPPLIAFFQDVEVTTPAGACFGFGAEGGATLIEDTNEIVSIFLDRGGCPTAGLMPRLDTPEARSFLGQFVTLP